MSTWQELQSAQASRLRPPVDTSPSVMDEGENTGAIRDYAELANIASGVPGMAVKALAGPALLLAKMALSKGRNVPSRFRQSGQLISGDKGTLNQELTPIHKTNARGLASALEDPQGLFAPSYAITKGETLGDKFGKITLALRGEAVDPANKPGILFNRDAYTSRLTPERTEQAIRNLRINTGGVRNARGNPELEFYETSGGRFGEGSDPRGGIPHGLAIDQSPSFRSHADYLTSPRGASLLDPTFQRKNSWAQQQRPLDDFYRALRNAGMHPDDLDNIFAQGGPGANAFIKQAARGDWTGDLASIAKGDYATPVLQEKIQGSARQLVKQSRTSPAQYAEGKVLDRVPLDPRNVRGVIIPDLAGTDKDIYRITEMLRDRGIPIARPDMFAREFPGMEVGSLAHKNAILRRISSKD